MLTLLSHDRILPCTAPIVTILLASLFSPRLQAQLPSTPGIHICQAHPESWHGFEGDCRWKRVSFEDTPGYDPPVITYKNVSIDRVFGQSLHNATCQDQLMSITDERKRIHSVTLSAAEEVGVDVDFGAVTILFAKIKASAHAKVTFNQEWVETFEETITVDTQIHLHPCQKMFYQVWKNKYEAAGYVHLWNHKITCRCFVHLDEQTHYCKKRTIFGEGRGFEYEGREWVQRGLLDPCPCANIVDDTDIVFEPTGPPIVSDDDTNSGGTD